MNANLIVYVVVKDTFWGNVSLPTKHDDTLN
jgi:hypothetical protein